MDALVWTKHSERSLATPWGPTARAWGRISGLQEYPAQRSKTFILGLGALLSYFLFCPALWSPNCRVILVTLLQIVDPHNTAENAWMFLGISLPKIRGFWGHPDRLESRSCTWRSNKTLRLLLRGKLKVWLFFLRFCSKLTQIQSGAGRSGTSGNLRLVTSLVRCTFSRRRSYRWAGSAPTNLCYINQWLTA